jgi:hypothetical protein
VRGAFDVASEDVIDATDFFRAEYSGLIAAPGMPKAVSTLHGASPERRLRLLSFCSWFCASLRFVIVYKWLCAECIHGGRRRSIHFLKRLFHSSEARSAVAFRRMWRFSKLLYTKNNSLCSICGIGLRHSKQSTAFPITK